MRVNQSYDLEDYFKYEDYIHALSFLEYEIKKEENTINSEPEAKHTVGRVRTVEVTGFKPNLYDISRNYNHANTLHFLKNIILKYGKYKNKAEELAYKILIESELMQYDPLFVAAVIKSESAFNEFAKSHVGATGLMQIMPATGKVIERFKDFEPILGASLTDPNYNLKLGIRYLKYLDEMFNHNKLLVLIAYNWGPGRVLDAFSGKRKIPPEVIKYATKILSDHAKWVKQLSGV